MNLYEINSQILDCIDQETGEVMDIDRLEELNMGKGREGGQHRLLGKEPRSRCCGL